VWHASIATWETGASSPTPWARVRLKDRAVVRDVVIGLLAGVGAGDTRRDRGEIVSPASLEPHDGPGECMICGCDPGERHDLLAHEVNADACGVG
jgi:hypothetical protein